MPKSSKRQPLKAVLIVFASLIALFIAAGAIYWHEINVMPSIAIPTPAMPRPNAFDYLMAASKLEVRQDDVENTLLTGPMPVFTGTAKNWKMTWSPAPKYTLAQKEELARLNGPALAKLREGLNYPYMSPPIRSYNNLSGIYFAKLRYLARLLSFYGHVAEQSGDRNTAIKDYLDAIQLGEKVPYDSGELGRFVGIGCSGIGRKPMWPLVDHLNSAQARNAAASLELIRAQEYPLVETFQQEKWAQQASMQEALRQPGYPAGTVKWLLKGYGPDFTEPQKPVLVAGYLTSKRTIMNDTDTYWDAWIHVARSPTPLLLPVESVHWDWLNYYLGSFQLLEIQRMAFGTLDNQAQNALLDTSLALRAYKLDHGSYPSSLSLIVPAYLRRVPKDPFAPESTLRYRLAGESYLLYSVGPDGVDDGGKPCIDPRYQKEPAHHEVTADSSGDIVAGVNTM